MASTYSLKLRDYLRLWHTTIDEYSPKIPPQEWSRNFRTAVDEMILSMDDAVISDVSATTFTISWSQTSGETQYQTLIEVSESSRFKKKPRRNFSRRKLKISNYTPLSSYDQTVENLKPNTSYNVRVTFTSDVGTEVTQKLTVTTLAA